MYPRYIKHTIKIDTSLYIKLNDVARENKMSLDKLLDLLLDCASMRLEYLDFDIKKFRRENIHIGDTTPLSDSKSDL